MPRDRALLIYGCSLADAIALNGGLRLSDKGGAASKYNFQRLNAARRGIEWQISLAEWIDVWVASGHYEERGRGHGYCMARHGDVGPYSKSNVSIITCAKNSSDSYMKTPAAIRYPKAAKCHRGHEASIYRAKSGKCRACENLVRRERRARESTRDKTACIRGHENSVFRDRHGNCRACMKIASAAYYRRKVSPGDTARVA